MSNWFTKIPGELKRFFTNPAVEAVISEGLGIASIIDPALSPLFMSISAAAAKAEALAASANATTGSGAQKLALALADAQIAFSTYETAAGVKIETAKQTAIINAVVALLNSISASTVASPTPATPAVEPVNTATAPLVAGSLIS